MDTCFSERGPEESLGPTSSSRRLETWTQTLKPNVLFLRPVQINVCMSVCVSVAYSAAAVVEEARSTGKLVSTPRSCGTLQMFFEEFFKAARGGAGGGASLAP